MTKMITDVTFMFLLLFNLDTNNVLVLYTVEIEVAPQLRSSRYESPRPRYLRASSQVNQIQMTEDFHGACARKHRNFVTVQIIMSVVLL